MKKILLFFIVLFLSSPALACRMVAIYGSGNPFLIDQLLSSGENSLLEQSKPDRKHIISHYKNFNPKRVFSKNYQHRLKEGNIDGWGIVTYNGDSTKYSGIEPAYKSLLYKSDVIYLANKKPKIVLAHIRAACDKSTIKLKNTHPFRYHHWSFMHNGYLNNLTIKGLEEYEVDSNKAFHFILQNISKELDKDPKHLTIEKIGLKKFKKIFKSSIKTLIKNSSKPYVANFIITDGEKIFAYKDGAELFIGEYKGNTIISSEIIQPKFSEAIEWKNAPRKRVIIID